MDWVIDAAAQPSVLAGRDGKTSTRQLLEHNLLGTINLLEYCRTSRAGFILLSTSRVYSIPALRSCLCGSEVTALSLSKRARCPRGGPRRHDEPFSTEAPISFYGATKLASERLAQEYARASRSGLDQSLRGAGGSGTVRNRGAGYLFLLAACARRAADLKYLGFGGHGFQVRDALHPRDLARLVDLQLRSPDGGLLNVSGGRENSMSLAQLTAWCDERFGPHAPVADGSDRPYDVPWLILDLGEREKRLRLAARNRYRSILEEIAVHATENPDWLKRCGA